jgi:uncharacterized membrane protein YjjB (DUF3815 family)
MTPAFLLHQTLCGAIAAGGFGVLFNVGFRRLPWYAASGAVALAVRTCCLGLGWNLEGASFAAALVAGLAVQLLRTRTDISRSALDVVGCIPMVPGSFAAKAILGLYALTSAGVSSDPQVFITAMQYSLRVAFTIGAIGTGLAIPTLLLRMRKSRSSRSRP